MKVKDNLVGVLKVGDVDYISLTDLAKFKDKERYDYKRCYKNGKF